eukprot:808200-Rhodomonas_salina.2
MKLESALEKTFGCGGVFRGTPKFAPLRRAWTEPEIQVGESRLWVLVSRYTGPQVISRGQPLNVLVARTGPFVQGCLRMASEASDAQSARLPPCTTGNQGNGTVTKQPYTSVYPARGYVCEKTQAAAAQT